MSGGARRRTPEALPVLVSAVQTKADVLVTGDKKDLLKSRNAGWPLMIASPPEFLDEILPRFLKG
jgi:predicted nucleic acid-binding protein